MSIGRFRVAGRSAESFAHESSARIKARLAWTGAFIVFVLAGALIYMQVGPHARRGSAAEAHSLVDRQVSALLADIPQHGSALGSPRAPITLQVFGDLQCVDVKYWFDSYLPEIIRHFVRSNILRLEYRAMKTDTLDPKVFVNEHTAALAAGDQDAMWNFLAIFYHEQGPEYKSYVTNDYLTEIAEQVPELELARWKRDQVPALAKAVIANSRTARRLGFHDTPGFRIGRTGGTLRNLSGSHVWVYHKYHFHTAPNGEIIATRLKALAHPLSLVDAHDIDEALRRE